MANLISKVCLVKPVIDIRTQGSEVFIPEFANKMGVAFSSPPYFKLENYSEGSGQSTVKYSEYDSWLNLYWAETVKNIHKYLVQNGNFLLNVKSYDKYNLHEDMRHIIEKNGFVYKESFKLKNIQRVMGNGVLLDNSEDIRVFVKVDSGDTTPVFW